MSLSLIFERKRVYSFLIHFWIFLYIHLAVATLVLSETLKLSISIFIMLHKCLSATFAVEIFTIFGQDSVRSSCFFRVYLFKKGIDICNFSFGKIKKNRRIKIIFNFQYTCVSVVFSNDPFIYFLSIVCINNIVFWLNSMFSLLC